METNEAFPGQVVQTSAGKNPGGGLWDVPLVSESWGAPEGSGCELNSHLPLGLDLKLVPSSTNLVVESSLVPNSFDLT